MALHLIRLAESELESTLADEERVRAMFFEGDLAPLLYLDKAWHGLHWLICRDAWGTPTPAGEAVMGGTPTAIDFGTGPLRVLAHARVVAIADALEAITEDTLRSRFDPEAMDEEFIYPMHWQDPEMIDFPLGYWPSLKSFYRAAASGSEAVLLAML